MRGLRDEPHPTHVATDDRGYSHVAPGHKKQGTDMIWVAAYLTISILIAEFVFYAAYKDRNWLALPRNRQRLYPFVVIVAIPYAIFYFTWRLFNMRVIPHTGPDTTRDWAEVIALMASDSWQLKRIDTSWALELVVSPEEKQVIRVPQDQVEELKKKPKLIRFEKDRAFIVQE